MELPNSQTSTDQQPPLCGWQSKPTTGKRSTRSQASPEWSLQELLFLVNEVSATESDFTRSLSSYQKWQIISDNCTSLGIVRTHNQCRRRWELLLSQHKAIKDWESRSRVSYWTLDAAAIAEAGLPAAFDKELFIFVDDNVKVKEKKEKKEKEKEKENRTSVDTNSDADFTVASDSGLRKGRIVRPQKSKNEEQQEISEKLREQAEQIRAIVNGNSEGNVNNDLIAPRPGETQVEFKRRQADELIKLLGNLAPDIDRLYDLVRGG